MRAERGQGQVAQGHWEDLGFYPKGGGKEGQNLTQVFTGALWWLLHGGQTIGRGGAGGEVITLVQVGDVRMD